MKRFTALTLAVLLMLCSCAAQPEPIITTPPTETIPATEPVGIYDPDSRLEKQTAGALKVFPLGLTDAIGIAEMGDDLLLFSGSDTTTLTRFSGEILSVCATATLNCSIAPHDAAVQVNEAGIAYYDKNGNQLVFLDGQLQEIRRLDMPNSICGEPALSANWQEFYYCTSDALRCLNLETMLDRFVMQLQFGSQTLTALHCNDTIAACDVIDERGAKQKLYVSTANGAILYEADDDLTLHTAGTSYFAQHKDGSYTELLIGDSEQGPTLLTPDTYDAAAFPLLEISGTILMAKNGAQLDFYDLRSGRRTSSIALEGMENIRGFHASAESKKVWFLGCDPQYAVDVLYCWDLEKTAISESRSCLSTRYTAENPDLDGLFSCREIADTLSETYGVQVLLWTDATTFQPWDYTLIPEYQVPVIREKLKELEQFLSLYPKGFLEKAAEITTSGRIQICLVRSIVGKDHTPSALNEAVGLQYWDQNKNTYLCISVQQEQLIQNACHEMSHIIDSRVLTFCRAYDDWSKLNPSGFQYSQNYAPAKSDHQWTEGAQRAFIDTYSMSYPKEDRARIMEYAMMDANEAYFESETMQKKLRQICLGIREGFGLKKSTEIFRWEQYLKQPLNQK